MEKQETNGAPTKNILVPTKYLAVNANDFSNSAFDLGNVCSTNKIMGMYLKLLKVKFLIYVNPICKHILSFI